jgi:hypothetical protein
MPLEGGPPSPITQFTDDREIASFACARTAEDDPLVPQARDDRQLFGHRGGESGAVAEVVVDHGDGILNVTRGAA